MKLTTRLMIFFMLTFAPWPVLGMARAAVLHTSRPTLPPKEGSGAEGMILDWTAFGSGCKSSKTNPTKDVQFAGQFSQSFVARLSIQSLELRLGKKDKGVSECAIRFSVQPPKGQRISNIIAHAPLLANKDNQTHLRARLLLLAGETLVATQDWDLRPSDFARYREETIILASGSKADQPMPKLKCDQPQIIGLDYTFEGLLEKNSKSGEKSSQDVWLRTGNQKEKDSARIEVFFEKCVQ